MAQFEAAYGPQGDWAQLFAKGEGYEETQLLRDTSNPLRYVTLDFWISREAQESFWQEHAQEYRVLDGHCERLTVKESNLGEFETD